MLHLRQSLRRGDHPPQTVVVKLVSRGASGASTKNCAHRDTVVFVRNILMDRVVRETRKRKVAAREKDLSLISRREFLDAIEDLAGLFPSQHPDLLQLFSVPLYLCGEPAFELATLVSASHLDSAKSRRRRAMSRAHHLLRLSLATVRRTPERPLIARADRIQRIPELRRDAGIRRVLHHAHTLAVLDLPANLAAELKVIAAVVNRPRTIGLHQDAVIGGRDQLFECQRLYAGQETDVSHPDHGQTVPAFSAQRSAGAILADGVRGLARTEVAGKQSIGDDRRALRRNALIVEGKRSQARPVLLARVRDHIHHLAAIAQSAQLVECKEGSAREIRLHAQHAIEFDGMPDRFMNLQPQLRAVENDVERAFGALFSSMQRNSFFRDAARVLDQLQLIYQLIAPVLPLSAVRIGIRPFLNLVVRKHIRSVARACRILRLMNISSLRRYEPLLLAIEVEVGLGQGNAGNGTKFGVDIQ